KPFAQFSQPSTHFIRRRSELLGEVVQGLLHDDLRHDECGESIPQELLQENPIRTRQIRILEQLRRIDHHNHETPPCFFDTPQNGQVHRETLENSTCSHHSVLFSFLPCSQLSQGSTLFSPSRVLAKSA